MDEYEAQRLAEFNKLVEKHHVILPDGLQETELPYVRRPLVLYRGKPVTRQQAIELITGEDSLFGPDCGGSLYVFCSPQSTGPCTWVFSDGTIGMNEITAWGKHVDTYAILPFYVHLAERYPFLDMVISYTTFNECCCWFCDGITEEKHASLSGADCKYKECRPYRDLIAQYRDGDWSSSPDFEELYFRQWDTEHVRLDAGDRVELTVWIHEGKTELLFGDRAREKFREYDGLYCAPEYALMFCSGIYEYAWTSVCICDRAFTQECFEYAGMPRERIDEYVERGILAPFDDSAQVVTKEWMIEQYRKYIAKDTSEQ